MGKKKKRTYESEEDSGKETKKKNKKKGTGKKYVIEKKKTKKKTKEKSRNRRHEVSYDSSQSEGRNSSGKDYRHAKIKRKKVTKINIDSKSDERSSDEQFERVSDNSSKNGGRHFQNKTTKKNFCMKFIWVYAIFLVVVVIIGILNYPYITEIIQSIKTLGEVTNANETSTAKPDPQKTPGAPAVVSENLTKESKKETTKEQEENKTKEQELSKIKTRVLAEEYDVSTTEKLPEMEKILSEKKPVILQVRDDRYAYLVSDSPYTSQSIHPGRMARLLHAVDLPTEGEMAKINAEKKKGSTLIELSCLNKNTTSDGKVIIDSTEQDHIDEMNKMNVTFSMSAFAQPIMRSRNKKASSPISDDLNETTITHFKNKTKVETITRDVNENENEDVIEDVNEEKKEIIIPPEATPLFEPITISLESNENPNYLYYCNIPPRHVTEKLIFQFFREQRKKKKILYFSTSIDFNEVAFKLKLLEETTVGDALKGLTSQEVVSSEKDSVFFYVVKKVFGYKTAQSVFANGMIKNVKNIIGFESEEEKSKESPSTRITRLIKMALIFCVVQFIIVYFMCSCIKGIFKVAVTTFCKLLICCCCGGKGQKKKSVA